MLIGDTKGLSINLLKVKVEDTFGIDVKIKEDKDEPIYAYDSIRHQYYSTKILKNMLNKIDNDCIKMLGITNVDLCTPILDFVFGEAQLNGYVAIVSLRRLNPQFYGLKEDLSLFIDRLLKEIIHELGHTFGLTHCNKSDCVMSLSTNIIKVDEKNATFCDACFERLKKKIKGYGEVKSSNITQYDGILNAAGLKFSECYYRQLEGGNNYVPRKNKNFSC